MGQVARRATSPVTRSLSPAERHLHGESRWADREIEGQQDKRTRANEFMRCILAANARERGPVSTEHTDWRPEHFEPDMLEFLQTGATTFNGILADNFDGWSKEQRDHQIKHTLEQLMGKYVYFLCGEEALDTSTERDRLARSLRNKLSNH